MSRKFFNADAEPVKHLRTPSAADFGLGWWAGVAVVFAAIVVTGCALPATGGAEGSKPAPAADVSGYLSKSALFDSAAFLPSPPAPGTAAQAADDQGYRAARALKDTARWRLAIRDSEYRFPKAAEAFSCALGIAIDERRTPQTYALLRRTFVDAAWVNYKAKDLHRRAQPFKAGNDSICTPELTEAYRKSTNSYPSNNATIGWVWALVLSEVAPDRILPLMRRGRDFGDGRVICGLHWPSDIAAGRDVGAALFAQLQASGEYPRQAEAARREVEALRGSGAAPQPDCALETEAAGIR